MAKHTGLASSQAPASQASKKRILMLEDNRDMIERGALEHLKENGSVDDVVLLVLDADDPEGASIARAFAPEFAPQFDAMRSAGQVPTLTLALPREAAAGGLAGSHAKFSEALASPPTVGAFWLCCVASGGATLLQLPIPERTGD